MAPLAPIWVWEMLNSFTFNITFISFYIYKLWGFQAGIPISYSIQFHFCVVLCVCVFLMASFFSFSGSSCIFLGLGDAKLFLNITFLSFYIL